MRVYVGFNAVYSDSELWLVYDMKIKRRRYNLQVSNRNCCRRFVVFLCNQALISYDAEL